MFQEKKPSRAPFLLANFPSKKSLSTAEGVFLFFKLKIRNSITKNLLQRGLTPNAVSIIWSCRSSLQGFKEKYSKLLICTRQDERRNGISVSKLTLKVIQLFLKVSQHFPSSMGFFFPDLVINHPRCFAKYFYCFLLTIVNIFCDCLCKIVFPIMFCKANLCPDYSPWLMP